MSATPGSDLRDDVYYPESDGKPMAETPLHRDEMSELIFRLRRHFVQDPRVYVSGNMMMYYQQGNPAACFSPDVFVAIGAGDGERRVYKLWAEACGPTVVFEISSRSTSSEDEGSKKELCQRLGVQEYWLYDPEGEYLAPRLQGYRLKAWHYLPIVAEADGTLASTVLGLRLGLASGLLDVFDAASGDRLLRSGEADTARIAAEEQADLERMARLTAEQQATQERRARLTAEQQAAREQMARLTAEQRIALEQSARLTAEQNAKSALSERVAAEERAAAADDRAITAETEALRLREELARLRGDSDR